MIQIYKIVPTFENGAWTTTEFPEKKDFNDFIKGIFKVPGKYDFDELTYEFNRNARTFMNTGVYCNDPLNSRGYIKFWTSEKDKCREGVIIKGHGKAFYLTRDYYMWINFLPIYDKEKKRFDFPEIWDSQYHACLYELLAELNNKHVALLKKRQWGNFQRNTDFLLSESGWIQFKDLKVGTKLWNPDGTIQTVKEIFEHPNADVYEVEFIDGRKTTCGLEHNWYVLDKSNTSKHVWKTYTLKDILEKGYYSTTQAPIKGGKKEYKSYKFAIPYSSPIPFNHKDVDIDPYLLGLLLGDGSLQKSIRLTTIDKEIIEYVKGVLGANYRITESRREDTECVRYTICSSESKSKPGKNQLINSVKNLGLFNTNCYTKFIPDIYKHSSVEQRLSLIQGLMDTDGYINANGKDITYTTVNEILANDFAYVCRSLGLNCRIDKKPKQKETHKDFYRVRISGNIPFDLFKLQRKLDRQKKRKDQFDNCPIVNIKKLDYKEDCRCIMVDNPNHLYITNDFIVTHNSYIHCSKIINQYWFEKGATCKIGASLKDYVNEKGAWKFLNEYRNFLNKHTGWYRGNDPDKTGMWQQRAAATVDGKVVYVGNDSVISAHSFEKDPTSGVGGNINLFYHEEAGIAPKMDITYEYIRPALSSGMVTTGLFIAAGSVGDLTQCQPLKEMILNPLAHSIYAVETDLLDDKGTIGMSGLFIPEQWSMSGDRALGTHCIDKYGNSLVEKALELIKAEREQWKKDLSPAAYQLRISQKPINIHEAFAYRNVSIFPLHLVNRQMRRIEEKEYFIEYVDLKRDDKGKIQITQSDRGPITEFPIKKNTEDKRGAVCIHERPEPNPPWSMYYASVDPVGEGKTKSSESLFSIYIYKNITEVTKVDSNKQVTNHLDRDKIVAWWTGRYDNIEDTHELAEMLIDLYNAWTIVEKNVSTFTTYMINKKKQHMLVPRSQLLVFNKDMKGLSEAYQEYGWQNSKPVFQHLLTYGIDYLKEVIDEVEVKKDGQLHDTIKVYGIERIPDIMLLKEMQAYQDGEGNFDRLVSYCALIAFAKIQQANLGFVRKVERQDTNLEKSDTFRKFILGEPITKKTNPWKKPGSPFKHFR